MTNNDTRVIEIYSKNFGWIEVPFNSLRKGDAFRIIDAGERYSDLFNSNNVWIATSDAYLHKGMYTVDTLY
jgi:hypothetical protein